MNTNEYLSKVLKSQMLGSDSGELKELQERRAKVEEILRKHFSNCSPTIQYGGSKAKDTIIREAYDLDLICYFPHDDTAAGETLKDIYNNTHEGLSGEYLVESKPSALRVKDRNPQNYGVDFHIDVVPGRYIDDSKTDVFIYQASGEKGRLKTNLNVHIEHVRDSGVTEAIRLVKLWRTRNGMRTKTFVLELLVVKLLQGKESQSLSDQLEYIWEQLRDNAEKISIEDPANPEGNDLSEIFNSAIRLELSIVAERTLKIIEKDGWEGVFGQVEEEKNEYKVNILREAAAKVTTQTKPWSEGS
jgi:hypothetical protein